MAAPQKPSAPETEPEDSWVLRLSSFPPQHTRPPLEQGSVSKGHLELVLWDPGKRGAGDSLLKPWFRHFPSRWAPQEATETFMRLYWTPVVLCLWPQLRANLSSRGE